MRRDTGWRGVRGAAALALMLACTDGGTTEQGGPLGAAAQRLVGTWTASFWLDPSTSLPLYVVSALPVTGTLAFTADHYGRIAAAELADPTDDGTYDLDFRPFGFSSRSASEVPTAVARVIPTRVGDSLYLVLSPGTTRFAVRMAGLLTTDSAAGSWTATAFSSGGGAGRFTMHRRRDAR